MAQTFNTILSFVKSTSRKDRRKGVGSLSVSAVAGGGVGSAADSATQAWVRDNFVDKTTEQEISALKIFSQGIKIGDVSLFKHPDGYVYLDETLVLKGGVVMYGNSSGVDVPSIFDSLPIDGETIKRDGNGALYVDETALKINGGGGGGGVADSVHWNNVTGKPSWIGSTKPTYKYSEIEERPDLSVYAKLTDIPSLNGYATQSWVENKGYLLATTASSTYQPKITSSNKLAYSLISNTPDLSVYALNTDLAKKWTQNDAKIANWDSAYSWGNHANAGYAKASDVTNEFKNYVKLAGNTQSITAQHNFANGLKIGGISLRKVDNHLYLDSSLVLSGGVTMYGDDGTTVKPIWESIPFDRTTIDWVDGKWTVVGGVGSGGISEEFLNVKLQEYQPLLSATNKLPYSLISNTPDLSVYATQSWVSNNYLSKSGGRVLANAYISWNSGADGNDVSDWNTITENGLRIISSTSASSNAPTQYSTGLHVKGRYGFQIASAGGKYSIFYIRNINSEANDWKRLALTTDLENYLQLSGGTVNGDLDINSQTDTTIRCFRMWYYGEGRKNRGMIRVNENNVALSYYSPTDGVCHPLTIGRDGLKYNTYDILHSGNYSNLLAGSTINGSLTATFFIGNLTGNADCATYIQTKMQSSDAFYPDKYKAYIQWVTGNTAAIKFTDGDYQFRADSATKLATARTIWGQSFDGTKDVTGAITVDGDATFSSKVIIGTIPIYRLADGTLFVDANVVFSGSVTMYGNTTTTITEE